MFLNVFIDPLQKGSPEIANEVVRTTLEWFMTLHHLKIDYMIYMHI